MQSDREINPMLIIEQNPDYYKNRMFYPIEQSVSLILETAYPHSETPSMIVSALSPAGCQTVTLPYDHPFNPMRRTVLHKHEYFELVYVIRGSMYQKIENKRHLYPAGSLCFLNRNIHHAEEFSTYFQGAFLELPETLIHELLLPEESFYFPAEHFVKDSILEHFIKNNIQDNSLAPLEYIDFIPVSDDENPHMYDCFERLIQLFLDPKVGSTFMLKSALLEIFADLLNTDLYQTVPINIGSDFEAEIFDKITSYMPETHGRISRSELSKELNYNGSYLNNIVKNTPD